MPQPYPKHLLPDLTIGAAVAERPHLALHAADVINAWAMAEFHLSNVFIHLLGANPGPAATVFTTLRNNNLQREALTAVAEEVVGDEDKKYLRAVLKIYLSAAKKRDILAHHLWAVDNKFPNEIIFVDPRIMIKSSIKTKVHIAASKITSEDAIGIQKIMRESCSVWNQGDFVAAKKRIDEVQTMLVALAILASNQESLSKADEARKVLLALPEIAQSVSRNSHSQKSDPEAPP